MKHTNEGIQLAGNENLTVQPLGVGNIGHLNDVMYVQNNDDIKLNIISPTELSVTKQYTTIIAPGGKALIYNKKLQLVSTGIVRSDGLIHPLDGNLFLDENDPPHVDYSQNEYYSLYKAIPFITNQLQEDKQQLKSNLQHCNAARRHHFQPKNNHVDMTPIEYLHRLLGHKNEATIKHIVREQILDNLPYCYEDIKDAKLPLCSVCLKNDYDRHIPPSSSSDPTPKKRVKNTDNVKFETAEITKPSAKETEIDLDDDVFDRRGRKGIKPMDIIHTDKKRSHIGAVGRRKALSQFVP